MLAPREQVPASQRFKTEWNMSSVQGLKSLLTLKQRKIGVSELVTE